MWRAYLRLAFIVIGVAAVTILFAFALTAAAIVVAVTLAVLALIGRKAVVGWAVIRKTHRPGEPVIIDHDPDDKLLTREDDGRP